MKKLLQRIGAWIDARMERAEKRKCERRGHEWVEAGSLFPIPAVWMKCRRYGCAVRTESVPASVEWHGDRSYTLSPLTEAEEWPEEINAR